MSARAAILLGGAIGTALRLGVTAATGADPWGTFAVNVTGAGALGFLVGRAGPRGSATTPLLGTGVLGAYTTFSALAVEVLRMADGAPTVAVTYAVGSLGLGLASAWVGLRAGTRRPVRS